MNPLMKQEITCTEYDRQKWELEARIDALNNVLDSDAWYSLELLRALIKGVVKGNKSQLAALEGEKS